MAHLQPGRVQITRLLYEKRAITMTVQLKRRANSSRLATLDRLSTIRFQYAYVYSAKCNNTSVQLPELLSLEARPNSTNSAKLLRCYRAPRSCASVRWPGGCFVAAVIVVASCSHIL